MPNRIPIRFIESDESAGDKTSRRGEKFAADAASPSSVPDSLSPPVAVVQSSVRDEQAERLVKEEQSKATIPNAHSTQLDDVFAFKNGLTEKSLHRPGNEPFDENIEIEPEEQPSLAHQAVTVRLERVEAELALVDAERQNLVERLTRVTADFENYRKRADREKSRTYQSIVGEVVQQLLPVHDNLARALEAEASVQATESEEFRHFLNGVELIYRQLDEILKGMGLHPVETVGRPFDPHVHEAVATEQTDEYEPDTVTQELVRGYLLGDTLLRPAMVKVSTK